jgi:hypothetical protein|tara:strand:+ start:191 stop:424 length:234 start_codon:yes stop_codon:yes gene_type:complete
MGTCWFLPAGGNQANFFLLRSGLEKSFQIPFLQGGVLISLKWGFILFLILSAGGYDKNFKAWEILEEAKERGSSNLI